VNHDFRSIFGARSFMTAMCVALDPGSGHAVIVGAGHPPLLIVRHDGTTQSIGSVAPPLGLKRCAFTETPIDLEPGDAFLLYTDGILRWGKNERRGRAPGQLEKILRHSAPSAEALLKHVLAQTAPENSAKTAPDDVAAIAVRREGRR
jgi:serine phosphatase RsbU (regulator of sigma subunit)